MISARKLRANRNNARASTGPRTAAGQDARGAQRTKAWIEYVDHGQSLT